MANTATTATCGQAELDLGTFQPGTRPLTFLATPNGQRFIAIFGDHIFQIRRYACDDKFCWRASVLRLNGLEPIISLLASTLSDAGDVLQAMALELGATS